MTEPLPKQQYLNVIRNVRNQSNEQVSWLQVVTWTTLRRLGLGRDLTKAVTRTPNGSDQVDFGSVRDWMAKVGKEDGRAIAQIVAIDATCAKRTGSRG